MYNARNGFISTIWGPALWVVIHCISLNFPLSPTEENRTYYRTWFEGLRHVLPCATCRSNFQTNLRAIHYDPVRDLRSRRTFSNMVYRLHNTIREMQGKPTTMTYRECVQHYERFRATDCQPNVGDIEGGCVGKQPVTCTLQIRPGEDDICRVDVHPSCSLGVVARDKTKAKPSMVKKVSAKCVCSSCGERSVPEIESILSFADRRRSEPQFIVVTALNCRPCINLKSDLRWTDSEEVGVVEYDVQSGHTTTLCITRMLSDPPLSITDQIEVTSYPTILQVGVDGSLSVSSRRYLYSVHDYL